MISIKRIYVITLAALISLLVQDSSTAIATTGVAGAISIRRHGARSTQVGEHFDIHSWCSVMVFGIVQSSSGRKQKNKAINGLTEISRVITDVFFANFVQARLE